MNQFRIALAKSLLIGCVIWFAEPVARTTCGADPKSILVRGIVIKPDGEPAAGAVVRAAAPLGGLLELIVGRDFKSPMSETKADEHGRFSISVPTQPFGDLSRLDEDLQLAWKSTVIAATLAPFGAAWVQFEDIDPNEPVTLKLVEDLPVRGHLIDLEGQTVAGATVELHEVHAAKDDDLSPWLAGIKAGELPWTVFKRAPRSIEQRLLGLPDAVTTTADGSFTIRGLGRERLLNVAFIGETVAYRSATIVTRKMDPARRMISPEFEGFEPVFGATFTFSADPARIIEGIVRDAKNGESLPGVVIQSDRLVGYPFSGYGAIRTTSDDTGHFRFQGMPKGAGNRLSALPHGEQPYFVRRVDVPDPIGPGPAKVEIELHRGISLSGRVTDKATGEPVPGVRMHYFPFQSNEFVRLIPGVEVGGDQMRYLSKADGSYRLVVVPGRAVVGAECVLQHYRRGVGYEEIDAPKKGNTDWLDTYGDPTMPGAKWPSAMKQINPTSDEAAVSLDLQLDPGASVRIRMLDAEEQPLTGVTVTGLTSGGQARATSKPVVVATNFGPDETRTVAFYHAKENVGRIVRIRPDEVEAGEITVELQPCGSVTGRLIDLGKQPVSGLPVDPWVLPRGDFSMRLPNVTTDAEGKFKITLLPGCSYGLSGQGAGFRFVSFADEVSVEPAETKDLGTLTVGVDGKIVRTKGAPGATEAVK